MNLTFNVCWIEDQASDALVNGVEDAIRQNGFEPRIERIETPEQIANFAQQQTRYYDYELILLDLQLGETSGDELAKDVRRLFNSTPLLFYSGRDESELRELMYKAQIEGVYCVHRDRLVERVWELVQNLSPALNRLNAMRGLASQVVAMCDQHFREIICHYGKDERRGAEIVASVKEKLFENGESFREKLASIDTVEDLMEEVPSAALYVEAERLARVEDNSDEVREILRSLKKTYRNGLLQRRHALAHGREERTDDGFQVPRKNGKPLTRADFVRFRSEFGIILGHVTELRDFLIPQEP